MSPQEHALSQSVLEFLIAQQDWFMLDIAPPPEGSPAVSWDQGVSGDNGFQGKWKEGTLDGPSREGSRVGTPNANVQSGPSTQRGQLGPSNYPNPQGHIQAPSPRQAYNGQSQMQLQLHSQSLPQSPSHLQSQQLFQPQPTPQHADHHHDPISPTNSGYGSDVDDVMVVPNSDEDYDDGWKLVSAVQGGGGGGGSGFMALGGGRGRGEGSKVGFREDRERERGREKETGIKAMRRRTALDKSGEVFFLVFFSWLLTRPFHPNLFFKNRTISRSNESSCNLAYHA